MSAPQMLISYDLTGDEARKDEFLKYMISAGWSKFIERGPRFDRLPNTTLVASFDAQEAVRTFRTAKNKATADGGGHFEVTHWTITQFDEIDGGVSNPSDTKAAALLATLPKDD